VRRFDGMGSGRKVERSKSEMNGSGGGPALEMVTQAKRSSSRATRTRDSRFLKKKSDG
jgi:hypothetical protein